MTEFKVGSVVIRMDGEAFLVKAIKRLEPEIYKGYSIRAVPSISVKNRERRYYYNPDWKIREGFDYTIYEMIGNRWKFLRMRGDGNDLPFQTRELALKKAKLYIDKNLTNKNEEMRFM